MDKTINKTVEIFNKYLDNKKFKNWEEFVNYVDDIETNDVIWKGGKND